MINGRPASLVLRVTVLVGIATIGSLLALGIFVQRSIALHFVELETEELRVISESVQSTLNSSTANKGASELAIDLEGAVSGHHGVYFLVADDKNSLVYATPGPDLISIANSVDTVESIERNVLHDWTEGGSAYSGAVLKVPVADYNLVQGVSQEFTIVVAALMDEHFRFLEGFNKTLWSIITSVSLFAILAAWIAARQAHAPLHALSAKISTISSDKLHLRLEPSKVPIELAELVDSFNKMIVKMEDVFERLSNFSADIAHEFRTPITNIITQTEVSLGKARDVTEYREILYSNLEEYERMAKMVSDMLFLAQTDNGLIKPTFNYLSIRDVIEGIFEYYEAWSEEQDVTLKLSGHCPEIFGDDSMLRRALSNLVSNAIDHTNQGQSVEVSLSSTNNSALITIKNFGKEIKTEQLPKIFDRFYQADPSRQRQGAGLGLAIVKSIIEIHSGSITVTSDKGMTSFAIELPKNA
ncbi:MAG: Cu(+)/Ag(+) sensor histidine kinase [Gammaproteobacteria bacterium]